MNQSITGMTRLLFRIHQRGLTVCSCNYRARDRVMRAGHVCATPSFTTGIDDWLQLSSVDADSARRIAPYDEAGPGVRCSAAGCRLMS